MVISLLGINHKTSQLHQREILALSENDIKSLTPKILSSENVLECIILSTCNRTEIYTVSSYNFDIKNYLLQILANEKSYPIDNSLNEFYFLIEEDAIIHLFRVVCGLDSMIIGEDQIAGQVRNAYSVACENYSTGTILNRLLHTAFKVSKRAKNETMINIGAGSIGYAAVELSEKIFKRVSDCNIMLIGAGDIAEVTAKNLVNRNVKQLFIVNRTLEKAISLADGLNGIVIKWEQLFDYLTKVDIIISTTGSSQYIVNYQDIKSIFKSKLSKPLLIIDIAVPRDFDPEINKLDNVYLVNIDGLKDIVENNIKSRLREIPKVDKIIEDELINIIKWRNTLRINPTIKSLIDKFEEIRLQELEHYSNQYSPEIIEHIDRFTKSLVNKFVQIPIRKLKDYNEDKQNGIHNIRVIQDIFNLEEGISNEKNNYRDKRQ